MHIGEYLKKKRIESHLTQEELSELVEVDVRTIRRLEKNANPTITKTNTTYRKIFDKLGISISDRQLIMNMISIHSEMDHLNPNDMLIKLSRKGPQDLLNKLEENLLKAYELSKAENYQDALDIYSAFAKIYPSEFVFLGCASSYEMIGEYDKAIEYCDEILSMETYQYEALYVKGTCLGSLKRYDEAIEVLENALQINNTYQVHYNLGVSNWYKHNSAIAIDHYKECIKLNPNFAAAHLNLGVCYFESMYLDESLHHIDEAIRLAPEMFQAYDNKGEHYRFIEQHDQAITYFEKCLRLDQENFQSLFGIAISFALKDDVSQSSIYFEKLFESYLDRFFNKGVGHKSLVIDIGYEYTRLMELHYVRQDLIEVYINDVCIPVNMNSGKSLIFIGSLQLSDQTGFILYPMAGKIFQEDSEFKEVIAQIQKSLELFRFFDHPLYVDVNNDIDVTITERENNVLIEMNFGGSYKIAGITDNKSEGFQSFLSQFEKHKELRIHLECSTESFEIANIKNVSLNLM